MSLESLAPALRDWLAFNLRRGCEPSSMIEELVRVGYEPAFAKQALGLAIAEAGAGADDGRSQGTADASIDDDSLPNRLDAGNIDVDIAFVLHSPRVVLFANLATREECQAIIDLACPLLSPSSVVDPSPTGITIHPDRTSHGATLPYGINPTVDLLEDRIEALLGAPRGSGEPLQVLRYAPGDQYKAHHDYFPPHDPVDDKLAIRGGQRVATLVMYLNRVEAGGATVFPTLGLDVLPVPGSGLHFSYVTPDGRLDPRTLHGGRPVIRGEKWIATKWYRSC